LTRYNAEMRTHSKHTPKASNNRCISSESVGWVLPSHRRELLA
jgi:hypothetical protein